MVLTTIDQQCQAAWLNPAPLTQEETEFLENHAELGAPELHFRYLCGVRRPSGDVMTVGGGNTLWDVQRCCSSVSG